MTINQFEEYAELLSIEEVIGKKLKEIGPMYKGELTPGQRISNNLLSDVKQVYIDYLHKIADEKSDI